METILKAATIYGIVLILAFLAAGCGCMTPQAPLKPDAPAAPKDPTPVISQRATADQCPTGGVVITIGSDVNIICNGVDGAVGPTGATGGQGSQGPTGATGANGNDGLNGNNGAPGTVITPVQFCSGFTPVYPTYFPESGLCIDHQVYGVYSTNGGFLALLTPGTYSSNGINASCNFTIGADCAITH